MAPKASALALDQYLQYHNRLASFHGWPVNWERNKAKPTPEVFARAGFFSDPAPPNLLDNVACSFCDLQLDLWDPDDEPLQEHIDRSPECPFVHGRVPRRRMSDAQTLVALSGASRSQGREKRGQHDQHQFKKRKNRVASAGRML